MKITTANATTNATHLMWIGRWIEVCQVWSAELGELCWRFKNGKDAADWLLYPPDGEDPQADKGTVL